MPQINEVTSAAAAAVGLPEATATPATVVDAVTVESTDPTDPKPVTKSDPSTPDSTPPAVPAEPKPETKSETKPKAKKPAEKKAKKEKAEKPEEEKFRRPPMEQLTRDFEHYLLTLTVAGTKITKLGYKCGKIIFGLPNPDGKDFRVVAYKARKKSKSVAGKSRCIFYFGLDKPIKDLKGVKTSKFGKCSVQSEKPVELIVDKVSFKEHFDQDADKVLDTLKKLADVTATHKTEQFQDKQAKITAKKEARAAKKEKKKDDKKWIR